MRLKRETRELKSILDSPIKSFDDFNTSSVGFILYCNIGLFGETNREISFEVMEKFIDYLKTNKSDNILGIGGEFYVYFKLLDYSKYIGISNHESIISDSKYNFSLDRFKKVSNYLVDYDKEKTFPVSEPDEYDIIIKR